MRTVAPVLLVLYYPLRIGCGNLAEILKKIAGSCVISSDFSFHTVFRLIGLREKLKTRFSLLQRSTKIRWKPASPSLD